MIPAEIYEQRQEQSSHWRATESNPDIKKSGRSEAAVRKRGHAGAVMLELKYEMLPVAFYLSIPVLFLLHGDKFFSKRIVM